MRTLFAAAIAAMLLMPCGALGQTNTFACNKSVVYDASTNGLTQLVPAGSSIYVCGYSFFAAGTVNVQLVQGTGAACATSPVALTPAYQFVAQTGLVDPSPYYRGMSAPAGKALCINASAGVAVQAVVYYWQN